jgi:hypothetical protein
MTDRAVDITLYVLGGVSFVFVLMWFLGLLFLL